MKLKNNKENKHKNAITDDMRTIADMNVPGMPWYSSSGNNIPRKNDSENNISKNYKSDPIKLTKGEKKAMLKAAFFAVLPIVLIYAAAFTVIMLLIYFLWLGGPF